VVNLGLTALMAISIFAAGRYVFKKTGSILYGMLIQLIPIIPVIWYEIIGRIMPELLLPIPIIALTAFLIGHLADKKEQFSRKDLFILGLILAFSLSIKLTLIPLWIIPFIIVKSWRSKIEVLIISILLFLIIAWPATLQIGRFWDWGKALFIHSGNYGNGDANILEVALFKENLVKIVTLYREFTILVVLQFLIIPFSFFWNRRKGISVQKSVFGFAVILSIMVQALITAKHYSPRYFVPAIMFGPFLLFLTFESIKDIHPSKYLKIGTGLTLILFFIWHINNQLIVISYTSEGVSNHVEPRVESRHFIKTLEKECVKIIVSQDYGCPMPEYALLFSTAWAANELRPYFTEELAKLYPSTYQYTTWDGRFRYWGEEFNPITIMEKDTPVYLYLEKNTEDLYFKTIEKLKENKPDFTIERKLLFENQRNGEAILQLFFSPSDATPNTPVID
jgi:hypothetical protein